MKHIEYAVVAEQREIASGIYSLWLETERIAQEANPGQFLSLYSGDDSRMLPRPISVCETDRERGRLRLVYRVAGKGTEEFSRLQKGEKLEILGPLGNGFPLKKKKAFLIGGGIGIPPMVQLAKELKTQAEIQIIAGYRDELFLTKELKAEGPLYIATEDGSAGTKGTVLDVIREQGLCADLIYACGPKPMLRAVKAYAEERGVECYLSMEERMACGIGACLACVCQSTEVDRHSQVKNKRVCKDGPVFLSTEVEL
ncbi:MAG: dihydroorotate dehydrogenase electron transfer subunit [Lachnospiraceae bacterium]|nr:dihydroorotate dehydrogenase electron transfer subunit [Lachnospiraceae bacterium]